MKTLRQVVSEHHSNSVRGVAARFSASTLRQLIEADTSVEQFSYMGYTFERNASSIRVTNKDGEKTELSLEATPLTEEQRKDILSRTWEDVRKFVTDKFDDLKDGKVKAEDIGAVVYGAAAGAIIAVVAPFAALGAFGKFLAGPFMALAANKGRYWGAAVDELVAVLKGENEATRAQIAGVLGTTVVLATYLSPVGAVVALGGTDAWKLTVGVGKWIGGAVEDALNEIGEAIPILGDAVKSIEDFFDDLF